MLLAEAVTLAIPEALVVAVELERNALAPVVGAAKVTVAPLIGVPLASFTMTCRGTAKLLLTTADCAVPPTCAVGAAPPAVLVSEKFAERLPTLAVTV